MSQTPLSSSIISGIAHLRGSLLEWASGNAHIVKDSSPTVKRLLNRRCGPWWPLSSGAWWYLFHCFRILLFYFLYSKPSSRLSGKFTSRHVMPNRIYFVLGSKTKNCPLPRCVIFRSRLWPPPRWCNSPWACIKKNTKIILFWMIAALLGSVLPRSYRCAKQPVIRVTWLATNLQCLILMPVGAGRIRIQDRLISTL